MSDSASHSTPEGDNKVGSHHPQSDQATVGLTELLNTAACHDGRPETLSMFLSYDYVTEDAFQALHTRTRRMGTLVASTVCMMLWVIPLVTPNLAPTLSRRSEVSGGLSFALWFSPWSAQIHFTAFFGYVVLVGYGLVILTHGDDARVLRFRHTFRYSCIALQLVGWVLLSWSIFVELSDIKTRSQHFTHSKYFEEAVIPTMTATILSVLGPVLASTVLVAPCWATTLVSKTTSISLHVSNPRPCREAGWWQEPSMVRGVSSVSLFCTS